MGEQHTKPSSLVTLARDFTLGFADGLTVPFALTAGMSSVLGRSDAVVLAGLAEVCAGSISMGIGGFLAMRDTCREEQQQRHRREVEEGDEGDEEGADMTLLSHNVEDEKGDSVLGARLHAGEEVAVRRHLQPLNLPECTIQQVLASIQQQQQSTEQARPSRLSSDSTARSSEEDVQLLTPTKTANNRHLEPIGHKMPYRSWTSTTFLAPILSGLIISLGYIIGGLIPLFPYLFTDAIEIGTRWSIGLCMLALFVFGAGKAWILDGVTDDSEVEVGRNRRRVWRCIFEGLQTLVLGMVAAGAAVLCVRVVDKDGTMGAGSGA